MLANISRAHVSPRRLLAWAFAVTVAMMATVTFACIASPRAALAQERIDPGRSCSLSVQAAYDKQPLADMAFSVRRVAEMDARGHYALVGAYADADVELNGLADAEDWDAAATKLAVWAKDYALAADVESATDSDGEAAFADLTCGVYLLQAGPLKADTRTYTASTYLVALPGADDSGAWNYNMESACKVSMTETKRDDGSDDDSDSDDPDSNKDASDDTEHEKSWAERWGLVQTGDGQLTVAGAIFVTGMGALLVGLAVLLRRRCGE